MPGIFASGGVPEFFLCFCSLSSFYRPSDRVRLKNQKLCDIFRVDCAIRKDYYAVNYAIFSSTILRLFYQDSEKENHFCAALTTIFS